MRQWLRAYSAAVLGIAIIIALVSLLIVARAGAHPHYPDRYDYDTDLWTPAAEQVRTVIEVQALKAALLPETAGIPWYPPLDPPEKRRTGDSQGRSGNRNAPLTFSGGVEQWRGLVERYFQPRDVNTALCIIRYESGGNPNAKNPRSSASGLWQHLGKYWDGRSQKAGVGGASIYDPVAATVVAAWLRYEAGGWGHWTVYPRCR